jgi:Domain of unknown function (DUF4157)
MKNCTEHAPEGTARASQIPFFNRQTNAQAVVQTKLTVGSANDAHEHEANRTADMVMRKPENTSKNGAYTEGSLFSPTITPVVQRACAHCEQDKEQSAQRKETGATAGGFTAPPSVSRAISRAGQGLDSNAKTFMESRFNRSFDNVQVHTDSDSAASARDISARAYTSGNHIVFGDGQYQPNTEGGRHLLAHELTHTVQQSGSYSDKIQRDPVPENNEDDALREKVGTVAGDVNSGGNIVGPIITNLDKERELAEAAKVLAAKNAARALKLQKLAGSGKSVSKSAAASKAAKAALKSGTKAAKLAKTAQGGSKLARGLKGAAKILGKLPLDQIGFVASTVSKYATSNNTTQPGKIADALITGGLDTAFSKANPVVAGVDAAVGLFVPHGERYTIGNTMSNSVSSITGSAEAIMTGDTSGIDQFHRDSKEGKNTRVFQWAAETGEAYAKKDGVEERIKSVGDYYGGADTVSGRAAAFASAMPIIGETGEFLGETAAKGVMAADHAIDATKEYADKTWTADPDKIDWDKTAKPWKWFD